MTDLLSHTESLFNHIYWFQQDFSIQPRKDHYGSAINWSDISERKSDFLNELTATVTSWVYNKAEVTKIVSDRLAKTNNDHANAYAFLTQQAFSKFRPHQPQGQFGELLLFNFLQHYFQAVPLLRKQQITTSLGHERFGSDAMHYKKDGTNHVIYIGESKCYENKYRFATAFKKSLTSICESFNKINEELNLYTYDDFIEPELEAIAKRYKEGTLDNVRFELVCLIAYNEHRALTKTNEIHIKEQIRTIISSNCLNLDPNCFSEVDAGILNRINYIIFPVWELDALLDEFQAKVGST